MATRGRAAAAARGASCLLALEVMATRSSILAWKIPKIEEPDKKSDRASYTHACMHMRTHTHTQSRTSKDCLKQTGLTITHCRASTYKHN